MSEPTNLERTVLINSIFQNFLLNRDANDYRSALDEMYLSYSTTEEFSSLTQAQRKDICNAYRELKDLINDLARLKAKSQTPVTQEAVT